MNLLNKPISIALLIAATIACTHKKIATDPGNVAGQKGVVSAWAEWVKPKTKKYDLHFHIKNESDKTIIVKLGDINCYRGERSGDVRYTFFNTGERTIDVGPGQDKHANMVCSFGVPQTGDFRVVIRRVFANPSNDGKTTGDVIAKDIVWQQLESKLQK